MLPSVSDGRGLLLYQFTGQGVQGARSQRKSGPEHKPDRLVAALLTLAGKNVAWLEGAGLI